MVIRSRSLRSSSLSIIFLHHFYRPASIYLHAFFSSSSSCQYRSLTLSCPAVPHLSIFSNGCSNLLYFFVFSSSSSRQDGSHAFLYCSVHKNARLSPSFSVQKLFNRQGFFYMFIYGCGNCRPEEHDSPLPLAQECCQF